MEYLIGGDCASLLRGLLTFEEDMARHYVAEVYILAPSFPSVFLSSLSLSALFCAILILFI
jgi:hypothetical protein